MWILTGISNGSVNATSSARRCILKACDDDFTGSGSGDRPVDVARRKVRWDLALEKLPGSMSEPLLAYRTGLLSLWKYDA